MKVCEDARLDIYGLNETKLKGCKKWEWNGGWGIRGGVNECREKNGVAIILNERAKRGVKDYGWVSSRLVWVRIKVGIERWAVICGYAPTNDCKCEEREKFWEEVEECMGKFLSHERVILIGDMNGKVGDVCDGVITGKWGVPVVNENGECLKSVCAGKNLMVTNTFFKHKDIHKYTWVRDGRVTYKSLIDFVCVDERLRARVMDARALRGVTNGLSDPYMVMTRIRVKRWRDENASRKMIEVTNF